MRCRPGAPSRVIGAILASACAVLATSCGGVRPADLFLVTRSGPVAGQQLTLLVNEEGGVSCNGGATRHLSDAQLVQAHALQEELHDPASKQLRLPAMPGSVTGYSVRDEAGTVSFADNSPGKPHVLSELSLFVSQVATGVCGLAQ
jgi:hypothetical protein